MLVPSSGAAYRFLKHCLVVNISSHRWLCVKLWWWQQFVARDHREVWHAISDPSCGVVVVWHMRSSCSRWGSGDIQAGWGGHLFILTRFFFGLIHVLLSWVHYCQVFLFLWVIRHLAVLISYPLCVMRSMGKANGSGFIKNMLLHAVGCHYANIWRCVSVYFFLSLLVFCLFVFGLCTINKRKKNIVMQISCMLCYLFIHLLLLAEKYLDTFTCLYGCSREVISLTGCWKLPWLQRM